MTCPAACPIFGESRVNGNGNVVLYDKGDAPDDQVYRERGRSYYDWKLCSADAGWQQYDTSQDFAYFGVWVHLEHRCIVTYAEGDRTVVYCSSRDHLVRELADLAKFFGDPPAAFVTYGEEGTRTEHFAVRPTGLEEATSPTSPLAKKVANAAKPRPLQLTASNWVHVYCALEVWQQNLTGLRAHDGDTRELERTANRCQELVGIITAELDRYDAEQEALDAPGEASR